MKLFPLAVVSLFAVASAQASGLAQLQALAGPVELAAPAAVAGRAVSAPMGSPAQSGWSTLVAETVRRGDCRSPSDDPDFHDSTVYCTVEIDPAPGFWGGARSYASVADGTGIHYYAETPSFPIGVGAVSGTEFRAVQTVTVDANVDGRVHSVVRTYQTLAGDESGCRNASRSDSFLVRDEAGQRRVTVCTFRVPLDGEERTGYVYQAQEAWAAALRR